MRKEELFLRLGATRGENSPPRLAWRWWWLASGHRGLFRYLRDIPSVVRRASLLEAFGNGSGGESRARGRAEEFGDPEKEPRRERNKVKRRSGTTCEMLIPSRPTRARHRVPSNVPVRVALPKVEHRDLELLPMHIPSSIDILFSSVFPRTLNWKT